MNSFSFFVLSIFIYNSLYFLVYKLINKEWPKTSKDYHIIHLQNELNALKKQNEELIKENQQISQAIIKRI